MFASFSTNPTISINFTGLENRIKKQTRIPTDDAASKNITVDLPVYGGLEVLST
jgi:hypothetical protein